MFGHGFESHYIKALASSAVAVLYLFVSVWVSVFVKSPACLSLQLCESVGARLSRLLLFITCLLSLPEAMWSACVRAFASSCQVWVKTCPLCRAWLGNRSVWSTRVCPGLSQTIRSFLRARDEENHNFCLHYHLLHRHFPPLLPLIASPIPFSPEGAGEVSGRSEVRARWAVKCSS